LVQEVLAVLVREMPHFRHSQRRGAFRRWLYTITGNRLLGYWRGQRCRPVATGDQDFARRLEQIEDPDRELSRRWDQEHDWHVAHRLTELIQPEFQPATWQAFRRVVVDGLRASVVAEELGTSVNAVLLAKSRVLRRLRQEIHGLLD